MDVEVLCVLVFLGYEQCWVSCGGSAWQNGAGLSWQMKTSGTQQDNADKHLFTGERVGSAKRAGIVAFPAAVMPQILLVVEKIKLD